MAELTLADALTLATNYFQAGHAEAAAKVLRAILARAPDCADAHNLLGLTAHRAGDLDSALASIGIAVRLVPEDANFHSNLGVVHKSRGALEDAEGFFRRATGMQTPWRAPLAVSTKSPQSNPIFEAWLGAAFEYCANRPAWN